MCWPQPDLDGTRGTLRVYSCCIRGSRSGVGCFSCSRICGVAGLFLRRSLWLWGRRDYIRTVCSPTSLTWSRRQLLRFRSQSPLVGLPSMDFVMDVPSNPITEGVHSLRPSSCFSLRLAFSPKGAGPVPVDFRLVWMSVAIACMARRRLVLASLIVRPFKRNVGCGLGNEQMEQTSGSHHPSAGDGGEKRCRLGWWLSR